MIKNPAYGIYPQDDEPGPRRSKGGAFGDPTAEAVIGGLERCRTCQKVDFTTGTRQCGVLYEMIGEKVDCWAWSADEQWEAHVQRCVRAYSQGWRGFMARGLRLEDWEEIMASW